MVGEQETGNETYILNLLRGLQAVDVSAEFIVLTTNREDLTGRIGLGERFTPVLVPPSPWLRIPLSIPRSVRHHKIDLLHVTYVAPPVPTCATVVSIHDIVYAHFPSYFSPRDRLVLSTLVPLSARQAKAVITLSQCTRRDLLERYKLPADKVFVVPLAAGPEFHPVVDKKQLELVKQRYGISEHFILAVGNLQPRKNLSRLIEAYARLRAQLDGNAIPKLVIVGRAKWRASDLFDQALSRGLQSVIMFTGYVSDEELALLYGAADLFVYPTLYEGFGLPPLEAMACGTPVICSDTSSLPEVVGDAAITVDPTSVEELTVEMKRVLTDANLRNWLSEAGLRQAAKFSWRETAQRTAEVYCRVLAEYGEDHS